MDKLDKKNKGKKLNVKEDCFYFYAFHYSSPTDYTTEFHCDLYGELPFYYDCNNCPHYLNKRKLNKNG